MALVATGSGPVLRRYGPWGGGGDLGRVADQLFSGFAIDPEGPLYYVSPDGRSLLGLDLGLGAGRSVELPVGSHTHCVQETIGDPITCTTVEEVFGVGVPTVMGDGTVAVPVATGTVTTADTFDYVETAVDHALTLVFLHPDGSTALQTVTVVHSTAEGASVRPYQVVPNGAGGVLAAWDQLEHGNTAGFRP